MKIAPRPLYNQSFAVKRKLTIERFEGFLRTPFIESHNSGFSPRVACFHIGQFMSLRRRNQFRDQWLGLRQVALLDENLG